MTTEQSTGGCAKGAAPKGAASSGKVTGLGGGKKVEKPRKPKKAAEGEGE